MSAPRTEMWLQSIREQARYELLAKADDEARNGRPHVERSERMMADAALRGEIDEGQTVQTILKPWLV